MSLRRTSRSIVAALAVVALSARARADDLSPSERDAIARGEVVRHGELFDDAEGSWVGATTWALVDAPPERVAAVLFDPGVYTTILPHTRAARWFAVSTAGERVVELDQGASFARATWTARIWSEASGERRVVRFRLDDGYAHEIDDARGWASVEPAGPGRTLLAVSTRVDLGSGVLRWLFAGRIQRIIGHAPDLVRHFFAGTASPPSP